METKPTAATNIASFEFLVGVVGISALVLIGLTAVVQAFFPSRNASVVFYTVVFPIAISLAAILLSVRSGVLDKLVIFGKFSWKVALKYTLITIAVQVPVTLLFFLLAPQEVRAAVPLFRLPPLTLPTLRSLVGSPIAEELFFRGWLMGTLAKIDDHAYHLRHNITISRANLVSSLVFTICHVTNASVSSLIFVFIISIVLGCAKEDSDTLALPMFLHFLTNFL